MPTLNETLKKLNKNVAERDLFKIVSEVPREYFDTTFTSFGSPYLDHIAGGIGLGRMTLLVGDKGSGKSSLALIAASELQKATGRYVVYFDGENAVDNSYMDRMGINRELLIVKKGNNLEVMLDAAQLLSESEEVGMIVIDSVKAFTSSVVEDKSAAQATIGIEAKILNARIPFIDGNCTNNNIALIVINQLRTDPGQMFGNPNDKKPGGRWQEFLPSLELHMTKDNQNIFKNGKDILGHTTKVRVKKSKYAGYEPKDFFTVNFYYEYGFNKYDEYAQLLVETGAIEKMGGWYKFPNEEKVQGLPAVSKFLESNDEYLNELINGTK